MSTLPVVSPGVESSMRSSCPVPALKIGMSRRGEPSNPDEKLARVEALVRKKPLASIPKTACSSSHSPAAKRPPEREP